MKVRKRILRGYDRPEWNEFYANLTRPIERQKDDGTTELVRPGVIVCPLGHNSWHNEAVRQCWQQGHFDSPIYDYIEVEES